MTTRPIDNPGQAETRRRRARPGKLGHDVQPVADRPEQRMIAAPAQPRASSNMKARAP